MMIRVLFYLSALSKIFIHICIYVYSTHTHTSITTNDTEQINITINSSEKLFNVAETTPIT